ncbi:MAG: hypothetical protein C5B51_05245 [Terriglobia bacterium]|nr:MAG: hypothetical protein C5B51_05245 [Terriglobia bacterium]
MFLAIAFTAVVCAQVDRPQLPPLGPGVRLLGAQAGRPGQVVKGAPFSADVTTEVMQTLSDGNKIRRVTSERVYRDSEGRTRREASLSVLGSTNTAAGAAQVAFIEDPVAGSSYALDLPNRTVTTRPWRQPPPGNGPRADQLPGQQRLANDPNAKTESLGRQTIAGVPADGTRVTVTIPAGQIGNSLAIQIVSERWYSPELQMVVLQKRSDPRSGETVYQMSNVIRAEPPSTLFVPPADFQTLSDRGPRGRFRPGPPQ